MAIFQTLVRSRMISLNLKDSGEVKASNHLIHMEQ